MLGIPDDTALKRFHRGHMHTIQHSLERGNNFTIGRNNQTTVNIGPISAFSAHRDELTNVAEILGFVFSSLIV